MVRSRSVGLFVLVLCLVACLCVNGDLSEADATKAAESAKESAKKVLSDVKNDVRTAVQLQDNINTCKIDAKEAAEEAENAAKDNSEAKNIAQKAKTASDKALELYPNASELVKKYLDSMKEWRTKAQKLDDKATNDLFISQWGGNNYTKIKEDALTIKAQVEAFNKEVRLAMRSLGGVQDAKNEMLKFVSDAQLAKYHVDVIVAIAKIDNLLETAESDIKLTEQQRDEINVTEQEMKNLNDNSPTDLISHITNLRSTVQSKFESASRSVEEAKKARERILQQKAHADESLVKVETENNVKNAKKEASDVGGYAENAKKIVEEIKKALQSARSSAFEALSVKESVVNELNSRNKKPDVGHDSGKTNLPDSANTHQPVKNTTDSPAVIEPKQPTVTNPDQSMSEQPVKDTTDSSTVIGTTQPTITNPDKAGSGGTEPTRHSRSDNAMTGPVSLLFALIIYAALH